MSTIEYQLNIGVLPAINKDALVPYDHTRSIVFAHCTSTLELASELCEGVVLQLLKQHQQGHAKLYLYEAMPSRQFSQIKRLYAKSDKKYGEQLISTRDCAKLLADLNDRAHRRYSQLAAVDADNIFTYNKVAPLPEPIIYLIITSLSGLSAEGQSLQLVKYLLQQGPPIGIVLVLLRSMEDEEIDDYSEHQRKQAKHFWSDLFPCMFGLDLRNGVVPLLISPELWRLFTKFNVSLGIDLAIRRNWADELVEAVNFQEATNENKDFLQIPIGFTGPTRAHFSLGERSDCYHSMIGGANGTGKTTFLNNIILSACEAFTPNELRFWLFDFKEGISFNIYKNLAHVEVLHVDNEDKLYAIDAFASFVDVISERAGLFRNCNPPVTSIAAYNRVAERPLPRLIMIIDEVQTPFDDRDTKPAAKRMIREISRKGRAFGLHLILSTQSYQNVNLESDEKAQIRLRIAFQLSSSMECRALMGRDNDVPLTLSRYMAAYNNNFGEARDNRVIKLDSLDDGELHRRLQELKAKFPADQATRRQNENKNNDTSPTTSKTISKSAGKWDWAK